MVFYSQNGWGSLDRNERAIICQHSKEKFLHQHQATMTSFCACDKYVKPQSFMITYVKL